MTPQEESVLTRQIGNRDRDYIKFKAQDELKKMSLAY